MELAQVERQTMHVKEAAIFLNLSEAMIYKLCRNKQIPHIKIGSRTMFKRTTLEKWLGQLEEESIKGDVI